MKGKARERGASFSSLVGARSLSHMVRNMADKKAQAFLLYKGRPLVRSGNQLYYGSMNEPCVVFMQILNEREISGRKVADKIAVQLVSTNPDAPPEEQVLERTVRRGLYDSIDVGLTWLDRALA